MNRYKYPRTYHFPFSPGVSDDDKVFEDFEQCFKNKNIVITEKLDGENTTVYKDMCHARSIDSKHQDYHSWLLNYARNFQYQLNDDERICGEYLYAKHSIFYDGLDDYFMVFSIWRDKTCLSWKETKKRCEELYLTTVPELYCGEYNIDTVKSIANETIRRGGEGIVMRLTSSFNYDDFNKSVIKYVRKGHVQTDEHWSEQPIIQNKLR